jgi:hypothetical protein
MHTCYTASENLHCGASYLYTSPWRHNKSSSQADFMSGSLLRPSASSETTSTRDRIVYSNAHNCRSLRSDCCSGGYGSCSSVQVDESWLRFISPIRTSCLDSCGTSNMRWRQKHRSNMVITRKHTEYYVALAKRARSVVNRYISNTIWPHILRADTVSSHHVSTSTTFLIWTSTAGAALLVLASVLSPLGLSEKILPREAQLVEFPHLAICIFEVAR